jgi:hypothetical protein
VTVKRCAGALVGTCVAVAIALGLTTAPALAATASQDSAFLNFFAAPGELNHVTMTSTTIRDTGVAVLNAGLGGCATADPQVVACFAQASAALVQLGDGDDTFTSTFADISSGVASIIDGGPGRDIIEGSPFAQMRYDARDGEVDAINCGGRGLAVVDPEDQLTRCPNVDLPGPPETAIMSGPPAVSAETRPTFTFESSEGPPRLEFISGFVECRLDAEPVAGLCISPFTVAQALADGPHVFEARAVDRNGDGPDQTPARYEFVVDAVPDPPAVVISPVLDRDGDGAVDAADFCPDRPGAGVPFGCPARGSTAPESVLLTALADVFGAGAGDDRVWGLEGDDRLCGEADSDRVSGGAGDDRLYGDDCGTRTGPGGNDVLSGGAGNDRLSGGVGDDRLWGGDGNDVLVGGPGHNSYRAGAGADDVHAANGRNETIDCGPGRDIARVDAGDRVHNCERVRRG